MVNEDGTLRQILTCPIEGQDGSLFLSELKYKKRIKYGEVKKRMNGVKSGDVDGRLAAYMGAATEQHLGIIDKLDTSDYSICQSIISFFL